MIEETTNSVPFLPVVSITKLDAERGELKVQLLNSPPERVMPPPVNEIISMCLNAGFQLSNEAMGAMQQEIIDLREEKSTKEENVNSTD